MMPKTVLNVNNHEIARGVRLLNNNSWSYLSFVREIKDKNRFQTELYPPFRSNEPAHEYKNWDEKEECTPSWI
jgi:hypothetical protein